MSRIDNFIKGLGDFDAALITKRENIAYLSGFTGEGMLVFVQDDVILVTDFRYTEQAEQQTKHLIIEQIGKGNDAVNYLQLCMQLLGNGCNRLAYEDDHLTAREFHAMQKDCAFELAPIGDILSKLRMVKDEDEIENLAKAEAIGDAAFTQILTSIKVGMTEREITAILSNIMAQLGSEGDSFDTIAASGENSSMPHAVPSTRKVQDGDLLTLDFGATIGGYHSDMTRTIAIGTLSQEMRDVYAAVLEAQARALALIAPGVACKDVDAAARSYLEEKYPGAFAHGLGHGIGLVIHEEPRLSSRSTQVLEEGMVVTVEPGVYLPGKGGVRIEDAVVVIKGGYRNLTSSDKKLLIL